MTPDSGVIFPCMVCFWTNLCVVKSSEGMYFHSVSFVCFHLLSKCAMVAIVPRYITTKNRPVLEIMTPDSGIIFFRN